MIQKSFLTARFSFRLLLLGPVEHKMDWVEANLVKVSPYVEFGGKILHCCHNINVDGVFTERRYGIPLIFLHIWGVLSEWVDRLPPIKLNFFSLVAIVLNEDLDLGSNHGVVFVLWQLIYHLLQVLCFVVQGRVNGISGQKEAQSFTFIRFNQKIECFVKVGRIPCRNCSPYFLKAAPVSFGYQNCEWAHLVLQTRQIESLKIGWEFNFFVVGGIREIFPRNDTNFHIFEHVVNYLVMTVSQCNLQQTPVFCVWNADICEYGSTFKFFIVSMHKAKVFTLKLSENLFKALHITLFGNLEPLFVKVEFF